MEIRFARLAMLIGREGLERLGACRVAVFGLGGVGGYVCEALARSGIGEMELVDGDAVSPTNLNRQIIALGSTLGRPKAEVMAARIGDINPLCRVRARQVFFLPEGQEDFAFEDYDYVVDAVDTVTAKLELAVRCRRAGTPLISSMGTGNKLNPGALRVADIFETSVDPLARVMRKELRKRKVEHLKVVYSEEKPLRPAHSEEGERVPGSTAFVPAAAGLLLASEVVKDLLGSNFISRKDGA